MTIRTIFADGKVLVEESVSGPTSYTTGGFDVRMKDIRFLETVISTKCNTGLLTEGFVGYATGNVAKVRVYYQTGVSGAPLDEVVSGYDLSGVKFTIEALGRH